MLYGLNFQKRSPPQITKYSLKGHFPRKAKHLSNCLKQKQDGILFFVNDLDSIKKHTQKKTTSPRIRPILVSPNLLKNLPNFPKPATKTHPTSQNQLHHHFFTPPKAPLVLDRPSSPVFGILLTGVELVRQIDVVHHHLGAGAAGARVSTSSAGA